MKTDLNGGAGPHVLSFSTLWRCVIIPDESLDRRLSRPPYPVWMLGRRQKSLTFARNQTPLHSCSADYCYEFVIVLMLLTSELSCLNQYINVSSKEWYSWWTQRSSLRYRQQRIVQRRKKWNLWWGSCPPTWLLWMTHWARNFSGLQKIKARTM